MPGWQKTRLKGLEARRDNLTSLYRFYCNAYWLKSVDVFDDVLYKKRSGYEMPIENN